MIGWSVELEYVEAMIFLSHNCAYS